MYEVDNIEIGPDDTAEIKQLKKRIEVWQKLTAIAMKHSGITTLHAGIESLEVTPTPRTNFDIFRQEYTIQVYLDKKAGNSS